MKLELFGFGGTYIQKKVNEINKQIKLDEVVKVFELIKDLKESTNIPELHKYIDDYLIRNKNIIRKEKITPLYQRMYKGVNIDSM